MLISPPDMSQIPYILLLSFCIFCYQTRNLERRNSLTCSVIAPNSAACGAEYVQAVEDTPILSAGEMQAKAKEYSF